MANEEQLSILKQGVDVWNEWRNKIGGTFIDLIQADLSGMNLRKANLDYAYLNGSDLRKVDFGHGSLIGADVRGADLSSSILTKADLREICLSGAYLHGVNLKEADLSRANLKDANLDTAILFQTNLSGADLAGCSFLRAKMNGVILNNSDLSKAVGLERVVHLGPSTISTDTFTRSKGKIPRAFLHGCGLSDVDIEYAILSNPDLRNEEINKILHKIYDFRASQALQISPLFISYSHSDNIFVEALENHLNKKGIRFWRDVHDATAGPLEKQLERAIYQNPTVLLILSAHSLASDWVEHEVRMARGLEKEIGRHVLCPIALDDSWKDSRWPGRITEQIMEYNILDFSEWADDVKFEGMFRKLIDGLELFYKG